jgi:type IV pilus assembly protein PilB
LPSVWYAGSLNVKLKLMFKLIPEKSKYFKFSAGLPSSGSKPVNTGGVVDEAISKVKIEAGKKRADVSIIHLVDSLIAEAHNMRASDVHIDPTENSLRVRYRVDGVLQDTHELPKAMASEIVTRIKILSGMRTDEHYAAQDGRFTLTVEQDSDKAGVTVDVRTSVIPTYHGENVVMRLLSDKAEQFTLELLNFSADNLRKISAVMKKPYGMILATGPTGSGKTTTLYTMLKQFNSPDVSIVTIEDPIEYAVSGIEQIQVNPRTGLTFAHGLRSILRQDPNIIMVGEIRDAETAQIAVNTSLTGHLLLSTVHTTDAATTLPRLLDMGIEPYLIASTVNMAIGQRLVRKVCDKCQDEYEPSEAELNSVKDAMSTDQFLQDARFVKGRGCEACNNTGYRGRLGIHEVLVVDEQIREAILKKSSSSAVKKLAIKNGMTTMIDDGLAKAAAGLTTIQEVLRVIHE